MLPVIKVQHNEFLFSQFPDDKIFHLDVREKIVENFVKIFYDFAKTFSETQGFGGIIISMDLGCIANFNYDGKWLDLWAHTNISLHILENN